MAVDGINNLKGLLHGMGNLNRSLPTLEFWKYYVGITLIFMVRLSFHAIQLLIYDAMNDIAIVP